MQPMQSKMQLPSPGCFSWHQARSVSINPKRLRLVMGVSMSRRFATTDGGRPFKSPCKSYNVYVDFYRNFKHIRCTIYKRNLSMGPVQYTPRLKPTPIPPALFHAASLVVRRQVAELKNPADRKRAPAAGLSEGTSRSSSETRTSPFAISS